MKKIIRTICAVFVIYCFTDTSAFGLGGIQIGGEYPVLFLNKYKDIQYKGKQINLIKNTNTDGGSVLLGYHYIFIVGDSIEQKFILDTAESEEIKVHYQSLGIGLMFRFDFLTLAGGFGYGRAYVECGKGCSDYYKNPEKREINTGLFQLGITYFSNMIFTIGTKYFKTNDFKNVSASDPSDEMILKNTSLFLVSIGFIFDY